MTTMMSIPIKPSKPRGAQKEKEARRRYGLKTVIPRISSLDLAGLKPPPPAKEDSSEVSFGYICFRTVLDEEKSRFYFIPIHDILPETPTPLRPPSLLRTPPGATATVNIVYCKKPPIDVPIDVPTARVTEYFPPFWSPEVPRALASDCSSAVFVYPCIYLMASNLFKEGTSDFYAFNLLRAHEGWRKLPAMTFCKAIPKAISVNRKIYCFGKPLGALVHPFVDVFDVDKNYWKRVNAPFELCFINVEPVMVPLKDPKCGDRHILLHKSGRVPMWFTYSLTEESFTTLPEKSISTESQGAVVDGVLYCYIEGEVVGYDLNSDCVWTPIPVSGLSQYLCLPVYDLHILGIGNKVLCVMWSRGGIDNLLATCKFFKMSKLKRNPCPGLELQADFIKTKEYAIPGVTELLDCLVI